MLQCDRTIFTSLPSRVGEGYRLVAWSATLRAEERQELTRRAPSHGSLVGDVPRGIILFRLQSSGRAGWGFTRVAGTEHTRRGGGRVWTDFVVGDAAEIAAAGLHPSEIRTSIASAPEMKQALGTAPIPYLDVLRIGSGEAAARTPRAVAAAASTAALLLAGQSCVIAAGANPTDLLEDAMRMIPSSHRASIDACAGYRFSASRGVKATLTDKIDQDTLRHTRGQGVVCVDLEKSVPALAGPLAPWLTLMSRWWNEQRSADAIWLADRLGAGWTAEEIVHVAATCEAIDRKEASPDRLNELLARRTAA